MSRLFLCAVLVAAIGCGGGKGDNSGTAGGGGDAAGAAGTSGSGGTGQCAAGSEGCACYGNDTCNGTLQCFSHLCVSVTGNGGSATGSAGATGAGGTTGAGGAGTGAGGAGTGTAGTSGANLIKNGDFSQGKTYWDLTLQAGEVGGSQYDGGEYCVANLSSSLYLSFSLGYPPTPSDAFVIQPNTNYTLSYRARSLAGVSGAAAPDVTVKIGHASPPYDMLVQFTGDAIVANYSTFTHAINSATGDTGAGLVFNGTLDYLTEVCFDDVTLLKN